ncbi:MAG: sigma-70 family RNA polymerase sigma factor [Lachnospiraceae bacterium]|nr:sigma-70 family RNA polymerase sigma factor [Lachnospiraceae bacterium]
MDLLFERSEQAIVELQNKYGAVCHRIADNILNNRQDTEECVNDTLLGVWNSIPPNRPRSLAGYICGIARNLALKTYERNTAIKRNSHYDVALEELSECLPSSNSVEEEMEAKDTAERINRFLQTLKPDDRILFVRRYWHADSIEELAKLFHTTKRSITQRLFRLRKSLKKGISL